jgi:hypothetical protein
LEDILPLRPDGLTRFARYERPTENLKKGAKFKIYFKFLKRREI